MPVELESLAPGIDLGDGVHLNASLVAYLNWLRSILPKSVPLHVNSGIRTAAEQASAMWKKYMAAEEHGAGRGADELRSTYGGKAELVLIADHTTWPQIIADAYAAGTLFSRHLTGEALDLRTRDLSPEQQNALIAAVRSTGARALYEDTPPHLHVDGIAPLHPRTEASPASMPPAGTPRIRPGGARTLLLLLFLGAVGAGVGESLSGGEQP